LSLILDLIGKKLFIKMYLRLGYNNMKIKEIDEEDTYKPTIIFF